MTHSNSRNLARVSALVCLAAAIIGCSSDDNHGPVVGAPTTPVVITEGGSANIGGNPGIGGTEATGAGTAGFGVAGTANFGAGGTLGPSDPFTGGTFGVGGTTSSSSGGFGF